MGAARADVVVVGGGASGLAAAAALDRLGRRAVVLERGEVGGTWARRYDRLALHTVRRFSGLPFEPLPRSYPRYVSKDLYARYLAGYADRLGLDVRPQHEARRIHRDGGEWVVETEGRPWRARAVVVATGRYNEPRRPDWPGVGEFGGTLLHSSEYGSGRDFAGRRALVVGLGNSGAEIASDLVEHRAAEVAVAVRTVPPITSREILGIPVQLFGLALHALPPRAVDRLGRRLRRVGTGDLRPFGLGDEAWGPFTSRRPPVIDVGFLEVLKAGRVGVLPAVTALSRTGAVFADGEERPFDVVVAATGFTTGLARLIEAPRVVDERGFPASDASPPGLFFAGYAETPRGQLFEAARSAPRLAAAVERHLRADR